MNYYHVDVSALQWRVTQAHRQASGNISGNSLACLTSSSVFSV